MKNFYSCNSDLCISTNGHAIKVDANREIAEMLAAVVVICLVAATIAYIAKS